MTNDRNTKKNQMVNVEFLILSFEEKRTHSYVIVKNKTKSLKKAFLTQTDHLLFWYFNYTMYFKNQTFSLKSQRNCI